MALRKKSRPGPCSKVYGRFLNLDMFGEQISFNIQGRTHYNTCCGVLFTLAIVVITAGAFYFSFLDGLNEHQVPTIVKLVEEEYFKPGRRVYQVRQDSEDEPFGFAIAVTSYQDYEFVDDSSPVGRFTMQYKINGGEDDGKTFRNIRFKRCLKDELDQFSTEDHPYARQAEIIDSHKLHDAFFCPEAFDLSFWGMKGDFDSKTLTVTFDYVSEEGIEDKEILLLLKNKRVAYDEKYRSFEIKPYTSMHWMPVSAASPRQTTVTYTRERIYETQSEMDRFKGENLVYHDFTAARNERIEQRPYAVRKSNPRVAAVLDFQLSHDLLIESPRRNDHILPAFALAGGVYVILTVVVSYVFSIFTPYFMYLHLIRNLFKVDNNQTKKPQSQDKLKTKNADQIIKEAKSAHKQRIWLTMNKCDSCMLNFESLIRFLTCGMNKWSRTIKEGEKQIKGELEIYNYMRRLRMTQATVNALTTFNQRRMLDAQIETSFLLQPFKKAEDDSDDESRLSSRSSASQRAAKRRRRATGESSSEESEEDFGFLDQQIKDDGELDEVSKRLLAGIIQAPPRQYKRFDKLTKEEIWERRRQKALDRGEDPYDEYDEEMGDNDSNLGTVENRNGNSDSLDPGKVGKRKGRKNRIQVSPDSDQHPPCPKDFDPAKWAKMTLAEKCKHLGIDMKDWLKMNREQQMQRMHEFANNFHFYAMDKPANKHPGDKQWHI